MDVLSGMQEECDDRSTHDSFADDTCDWCCCAVPGVGTGKRLGGPRTADGQPDLQGIWANNSATPLQRPEQLADKAVLSDEELAELTQKVNEFRDNEQAGDLLGDRLIQQALGNSEFNDFDVITGNYNAFWLVERSLDKVVWKARTFSNDRGHGVSFRYTSPDGEEGYPIKVAARSLSSYQIPLSVGN